MNCRAVVWDGFHRMRCTRTATSGEYCYQHDPVKKAAKKTAEEQAFRARAEQQAATKAEAYRLIDALGVQGRVHYEPYRGAKQPGGVSRYIVLSFETAEALITRLQHAEKKAGLR